MRNISSFIFISLFFVTNLLVAQQKNEWEGKWAYYIDDNSFCNVHILTTTTMGNREPIAIVEGVNNGEPFVVECTIEEIPQRNSIVLVEKPDRRGLTHFATKEPLLVMVTTKSVVKLFWGQLALGANYGMEAGVVKPIKTPNYKGDYTVDYNKVLFSLTVSTLKNNQFEAKLKSNSVDLNCHCTLRTKHYAICYEENAKGMFFLDFNEKEVRLINETTNNIFSANLTPKEKAPVVLHEEL